VDIGSHPTLGYSHPATPGKMVYRAAQRLTKLPESSRRFYLFFAEERYASLYQSQEDATYGRAYDPLPDHRTGSAVNRRRVISRKVGQVA
jgi:hypothetical protein